VGEVRDILSEGDEVTVKVLDYDESTGRVRLSRKAVIMEAPDYDPAKYEGMGEPVGARTGGGGGDRDRERGGGGRDRGGRGGDRGGRGGGGGRGGRGRY
jgi:polyribonucleotide nucleotidyltransferase